MRSFLVEGLVRSVYAIHQIQHLRDGRPSRPALPPAAQTVTYSYDALGAFNWNANPGGARCLASLRTINTTPQASPYAGDGRRASWQTAVSLSVPKTNCSGHRCRHHAHGERFRGGTWGARSHLPRTGRFSASHTVTGGQALINFEGPAPGHARDPGDVFRRWHVCAKSRHIQYHCAGIYGGCPRY